MIFLFGFLHTKQIEIKKYLTQTQHGCGKFRMLSATFGPGGLRAPCVLACAMRSLANVFTIVQSLFLSLSLLHLLLLTHFGESPVTENLFPTIFWHN